MTAATTTMATGIEHVIDQYIAAWNETNPGARRELIARTWTADGSYLDPLLSGPGYDGIDAMIGGVQSQFPGYRFRRVGELDARIGIGSGHLTPCLLLRAQIRRHSSTLRERRPLYPGPELLSICLGARSQPRPKGCHIRKTVNVPKHVKQFFNKRVREGHAGQ